MNIARIGLLIVALGAAGAAALLVRNLTHKPAHQPAPPQLAAAPAAEVLVAAHALDPGVTIKDGDLRWQDWPQASLSPNFLTHQATPNAMSEDIGMTVRDHIDLGEPITSAKLVKAGSAGFMAAMLTPGMRAISTKIDDDSAVGGFILPGDHVDVIMTRRDAGSPGEDYDSRTILSDVRVLAIGTNYDDSKGDKVIQGKTATLELSPEQAELLALADASGQITLALRSAANDGITGAIRHGAGLGRARSGGTIHVVKYGHASRATPVVSLSPGDGQ